MNKFQNKEEFIASITHPRKEELASMMFDGASREDMEKAGFNIVIQREMEAKIARECAFPTDDAENVPAATDEDRKKLLDELATLTADDPRKEEYASFAEGLDNDALATFIKEIQTAYEQVTPETTEEEKTGIFGRIFNAFK